MNVSVSDIKKERNILKEMRKAANDLPDYNPIRERVLSKIDTELLYLKLKANALAEGKYLT